MSPGTLEAGEPRAAKPQPCPRITAISDRLLLGGLGGGLSAQAIECILQEHAITHLVICGHRETDAYVAAAESAAASCNTEIHVAPLIPSDLAELPKVLDAARAFVAESIEDDLNCVLVACSKGASRSVAVVIFHLLESQGLSIAEAFETITSIRWRVWPSALLVETLLDIDTKRASAGGSSPDVPTDRKSICRRIGSHAALATAWHNGVEANVAAAEDAWDLAVKEGGSLEAIFARCKQSLLGLSCLDLGSYSNSRSTAAGPAHVELSQIAKGILLGGLGGLSSNEIATLLREHGVLRVLVCGRPGRDAHVDALRKAAGVLGLPEDALHVVPVADSASEDLRGHINAAVDFACTSKEDMPLLIACRQGASRSVSVTIAYLMRKQELSVLTAFQHIADKRWRLWPNAGFVEQLIKLEDETRSDSQKPLMSEKEKSVVHRTISVHAAWAANRQNLEETGFGRQGLTVKDVDSFWDQLTEVDMTLAERFERCKEWALGVDLSAFENAEPAPKKPRPSTD